MSIVPSSNIGKLTFYEAHVGRWTDNAASIGLLSSDCNALKDAIAKARDAYNAQQIALEASKSATQNTNNMIRALHVLGASDIAKIRAFADASGNVEVYPLADIPAPATPTPAPAPGKPTDFSVTLTETGAIMLKWKCANPVGTQGTIYEVRRSIAGSTPAFIGASGVKSFTDDTLPGGSTGVIYEVTAVRSTKRGLPSLVNVNFGVGGDGMMFATVTPTVGMKMAA